MNISDWLVGKAISANVPALLWGAPGVGKSARIAALAADAGFSFYPVVVSHYDPVELHGLLVVDQKTGKTRRAVPDWVGPEVFENGRPAILFFDELSTASPAQQAAVLRIFSDRELGGRKLGDQVRLVAAANPPELAAGGFDLAAPAANRFAHITVGVDAEDFLGNFTSLWAGSSAQVEVPESPVAEDLERARALISGFLSRRRDLILQVPPVESQGGAWPSPRTWELCSRLMAGESSQDRILAAAAATVGQAAAAELAAYIRDVDIPDPEDIIRAPEDVPVPERGDILYAALSSVVAAALGRPDKDRVRAVWVFFRRAAEAGHADVCGPFLRRLVTEGGRYFSPLSDPALIAPFRRVMEAAGK